MIARRVLAGVVLLGALVGSPEAAAKAFRPGDVSLCRAQRCLPIRSQPMLDSLASFYYNPAERPVRTVPPTAAIPSFRLEFSDGYVSGTVAGSRLDRFLSGGVNLDQFRQGVWYRLPRRVATGLKEIAVALAARNDAGRTGALGIAIAIVLVLVAATMTRGRFGSAPKRAARRIWPASLPRGRTAPPSRG